MSNSTRFNFGNNWNNYLLDIDNEHVEAASSDLKKLLGKESLVGITFLDIGSGSGLMSLAAKKMGAKVISFDYDVESVDCTKKTRDKYYKHDQDWIIYQGSVLDLAFLNRFDKIDIIYSWGVIHHTGDLWGSIRNIIEVAEKNRSDIVLAIYNDQGWISKYWLLIKRAYNKNKVLRFIVILIHIPYLYFARIIFRIVTGRYKLERGMLYWYDMLDWLGGYPFEVATPDKIISHFENNNYITRYTNLCGNRHGCNEFAFRMKTDNNNEKFESNQDEGL